MILTVMLDKKSPLARVELQAKKQKWYYARPLRCHQGFHMRRSAIASCRVALVMPLIEIYMNQINGEFVLNRLEGWG